MKDTKLCVYRCLCLCICMEVCIHNKLVTQIGLVKQKFLAPPLYVYIYIYYWKERDKEEEMKERWKKREKQHFLYYLIV